MRTFLRVGALGVFAMAAALFIRGLDGAFLATVAVVWLVVSAVLVTADHIGQSRETRAAARGTVLQTPIRSVRLIALALPAVILCVSVVLALTGAVGLLNILAGAAIAAVADASWLLGWRFNREKMERHGYRW
jgi:hypothetical protein